MNVHCLYDELVPVKQLKAHPKNRNQHPPEQIERLAEILKYQGWRYPVKVSKLSGFVTAGHGRIEAAKLNKWPDVPVNYQDYEDEDQEYADVQADNAIASWAELDLSAVNSDLGELDPSFNLDLLGIKNFILEPLDKLEDENEENAGAPDEVPAERMRIPEIIEGDCVQVLKNFPADSVDSLVSDPPAGISFMGKDWDGDKGGRNQWVNWMREVMSECHRVLKPGAHGLVWAIPRTSHWTATALEDAGFEVRDVITHLFGSGFPKSMDISKAIDKAAGAERELIPNPKAKQQTGQVSGKGLSGAKASLEFIAPNAATEQAKQWQGWGTALKPASEHWILVRKPLSEKTVADNVLKHGVGGINIDGSRIAHNEPCVLMKAQTNKESMSGGGKVQQGGRHQDTLELKPSGRFPANLVLSHNEDCEKTCTPNCPLKMLDEQSGILKQGVAGKNSRPFGDNNIYGSCKEFKPNNSTTYPCDSPSGASRFFYCAKPAKSERNAGLEELPKRESGIKNDSGRGFSESDPHKTILNQNHHPTVKPIALMKYLVRMITPPGGTVLDPFCGSGTTGVAAAKVGFRFLGIEKDPEYYQIAVRRFKNVAQESDDLPDLDEEEFAGEEAQDAEA